MNYKNRSIIILILIVLPILYFNTLSCHKKETLEVIIRSQTKKEAFESLIWTISRIPFYQEHGYQASVSSHETFQKLARSDVYIKAIQNIIKADIYVETEPDIYIHDIQYGELKRIFDSEVYSEKDYEEGLKILRDEKTTIMRAVERFSELNVLWDFKVFPQYEVILTMYGPQGSYSYKRGEVFILASKIESSGEWVRLVVIHELVHIGVEENIVKYYKLKQWEKERLVDFICSIYFKDLLPNYPMQSKGDKRLDEFINIDTIQMLPQAIEKYIKKYPRSNQS